MADSCSHFDALAITSDVWISVVTQNSSEFSTAVGKRGANGCNWVLLLVRAGEKWV